MNLVIAETAIRTDAEGRCCLNDLHRAAGEEARHRPSYWLENGQTKELIAELEKAGNPAIHAKQGLGTFVVKELVYAYAMWISAAFHLKVIRAYDVIATQPVASLPNFANPAEAARAWAEQYEARALAEKTNLALEHKVAEQAPKVDALDRIAISDGRLNLTSAAKNLDVPPRRLIDWMIANKWIYRRAGGSGAVAYQDKIQAGYLTHKVYVATREDGSEKTCEQVMVLPKGLAKLSMLVPPGNGGARRPPAIDAGATARA